MSFTSPNKIKIEDQNVMFNKPFIYVSFS